MPDCFIKYDETKNPKGRIIRTIYKRGSLEAHIVTLMPKLHTTTIMDGGKTKESPAFKSRPQAVAYAKKFMKKHGGLCKR